MWVHFENYKLLKWKILHTGENSSLDSWNVSNSQLVLVLKWKSQSCTCLIGIFMAHLHTNIHEPRSIHSVIIAMKSETLLDIATKSEAKRNVSLLLY